MDAVFNDVSGDPTDSTSGCFTFGSFKTPLRASHLDPNDLPPEFLDSSHFLGLRQFSGTHEACWFFLPIHPEKKQNKRPFSLCFRARKIPHLQAVLKANGKLPPHLEALRPLKKSINLNTKILLLVVVVVLLSFFFRHECCEPSVTWL